MRINKKQVFVFLSIAFAVWQLSTAFTSVKSGLSFALFQTIQAENTSLPYKDRVETGVAYQLPIDASSWIKAPYGLTLTSLPLPNVVSTMKKNGCGTDGCFVVYKNSL